MKRLLFLIAFTIFSIALLSGQDTQEMVSKCALSAGENTTYLKDFVIKLTEATKGTETPVYKANIYLMKGQNYRFTMCNGDNSTSELLLQLFDKQKMIISSYNRDTNKIYQSFDFSCNKTGLYTLWYSFRDGKKGTGVGVVSLVK